MVRTQVRYISLFNGSNLHKEKKKDQYMYICINFGEKLKMIVIFKQEKGTPSVPNECVSLLKFNLTQSYN